MKKSNNFYKDIAVGLFLIIGILEFMSGEFIISTVFFGVASMLSNLNYAEPVQT